MVSLQKWIRMDSEKEHEHRIEAEIELIEAGMMPKGWVKVEA